MQNVQPKISVTKGSVQETLLLPLWGRAFETQQKNPRLTDEKAVEILSKVDYDFSEIERTQTTAQHGWIARSLQTDRFVNAFIQDHPKATIVNLGCGMDTTFSRVDNGQITFYELDFPDVIALRQHFYSDDERHISISASLHDTQWYEQIKHPSDGLLFLAGGVFMYSNTAQMKAFFKSIANHFGACDFFFDALSPLGLKIGKKMVLIKGGMDNFQDIEGWALKQVQSIEQWDDRFKVISAVALHQGVKKGMPLKTRLALSMADLLGVGRMVHLRILADTA